MRNLRELGSTTMYGREMDGSPDQEPKYPSALLATAGLDDKIYIWHPETGDIYKEYDLDPQIDSQVNCLKFSGDGRLLAVTGYEVIKVYDVHSNRPLTNMSNNSDSNSKNITCVNFATTDNTSLITGGEDGYCRLWQFPRRNLKQTREVNCSLYGVINCLTTKHPDFNAVVGTQSGYILGLNVSDDRVTKLLHKKALGIQSIDCYVDKHSLRVVAMTNTGHLMSHYNGQWTDKKVHDKFGLCCVLSPDGQFLATGGSDAKIRLFRLEENNIFELNTLCDSKLKWIWCLQFSFDSQFLFVSSSDGVVQMWSLRDWTIKRNYRGHKKSVVSLSLFEYRQKHTRDHQAL